jgi:branched-chain amino acid transport system permease protein
MDLLLQLLVNGLINGSHYALLGVGFGLIFATTQIVHFAYGPVYALAAYICWFAAASLGLPLPLAALLAVSAAVVAGVGAYLVIYRPFQRRQSSDLVILIASLGLLIIIENLIGIVFGAGNRVVEDVQSEVFLVGPVVFTSWHVWQVGSLVVVASVLAAFLRLTRFGKAILGMTDNPEMARVVGIDTFRVTLVVFAIGSLISAVPAVLILLKDSATPHMGFHAVFMGFVAVVIGGIGSIRGAVLGGLLLGLVEGIGLWKIDTAWQSSIAFVVLFLVILLRPQGLFGKAIR